jgi:hypothetical protein
MRGSSNYLSGFFARFASDKSRTVKITVYGPAEALLFEAANDVQKARALLMPLRPE